MVYGSPMRSAEDRRESRDREKMGDREGKIPQLRHTGEKNNNKKTHDKSKHTKLNNKKPKLTYKKFSELSMLF
jgi:hypothetical protein